MDYIPSCEVAKIVRAELKKHFPATKFSVRTDKYSGGSSIRVEWTDGPTVKQVEQIAAKYHGTEFDGMIDLASPNGRPYCNDYIFFTRRFSLAHYTKAAQAVCKDYGLAMPNIVDRPGWTVSIKHEQDIIMPSTRWLSQEIDYAAQQMRG